MTNFLIRTKDNTSPQRKPRVYFTCHPDDFDVYFDKVCQDIFKTHDCNIFYTEDMTSPISDEDKVNDLHDMNVFVIPVTFKLLTTPNRAMDTDFAYAKAANIHILPILFESGISEFYARPDKFGTLQYLNPHSNDITEISYEEKLKKYLDSVLISVETANRIRAAFDAYIFLSYRKKDRKYANQLIKLVHKNPEYHHIAIWYDEFLAPGESFTTNIRKMIENSSLFALLVTPNLLEEPNFVLSEEYPIARSMGKEILPAEMIETDKVRLKEKYEYLPDCIDVRNDEDFKQRFLASIRKIATEANNDLPEHNFLIGLAYLEGIDVEVDRERAMELFNLAAEQGLPEAMEKMYSIYIDRNTYQTNYPLAVKWAGKLVSLFTKEYGAEHPKTLEALGRLAHVYNLQGSYAEALPINEMLYSVYSRTCGDKHPAMLSALNNLAHTLDKCGFPQQALEKEERAYALYCKLFGEKHPDTLLALHTLASTHTNLGHYAIALELKEKAYNISCEIYGETHPATLRTLNTLAVTHDDLGNYETAIELKKKTYELRKKVLGERHLDTITTLHNLAVTYGKCGNYVQEAAIEEQVYALRRSTLGDNHPDTLTTLNNLSVTYKDIGEYDRALQLSLDSYTLHIQTLGEEHPATIRALSNLSVVYGKLKDYEKSLELGQQAYALRSRVLGYKHPRTIVTLCNIADIYFDMGNYAEAVEKYETVYALRLEVLKEKHPETIEAQQKLQTARGKL